MIKVSSIASLRISQLIIDNRLEGYYLRVGVRGGGCAGLTYQLDFVEHPETSDYIFHTDVVNICCDRKSYLFLIGTELTYQESLLESGFTFINPAAKKSCGCGQSFSV